jgi:hypothetical protein
MVTSTDEGPPEDVLVKWPSVEFLSWAKLTVSVMWSMIDSGRWEMDKA